MLDTYVLGYRPSNMENRYVVFIHPNRVGVKIGLTNLVFQKYFMAEHGYDIEEARRDETS